MKEFDESKHPRGDDGKFTDGNNSGKTQWITSKRDYSNVQGIDKKVLQSDNGNDKITKNQSFIDIQLFAPSLEDQSPKELEKTIKSTQKSIDLHKQKIANPEQYCATWEQYDERKKQGAIKFWEKEIAGKTAFVENAKKILEEKKNGKCDDHN